MTRKLALLSSCLVCMFGLGPQSEQIALSLHLDDDFRADSRASYAIIGDTDWNPGRLLLAEGASLERSVDSGSRAAVTVTWSNDSSSDPASTSGLRIWFLLEGATDCCITIERAESTDSERDGTISFVDTAESDGRLSERVVRTTPLTLDGEDSLSIEYRYGLLTVGTAESQMASAYIANGSATVTGCRIESVHGDVNLKRFVLSRVPPPARLTPEQRQRLAEADTANREMIRLYGEGELQEAIRLAERTREIRAAVLGEHHADFATITHDLAGLYLGAAQLERAETLGQQALQIRKELLGEDHPEYGTALRNMAFLHLSRGEYGKAMPLQQQVLKIIRSAMGEDNTEFAIALNSLAELHWRMGQYAKAEPLYRKALSTTRSLLGDEHPHVATGLNNLASLYWTMGDYGLAEPLYRQASEIYKSTLGEQHPDYATSLDNLAVLYDVLNDYDQSRTCFEQVLQIRESVQGRLHPDYARTLTNLAALYSSLGEYGRAKPMLQEAMQVTKNVFGEQHPDHAHNVHSLGTLLMRTGDFAGAESHFQKALEIKASIYGERHPEYSGSLNNLAQLYADMGDLDRAEPLFRQVLELQKSSLGNQHPRYATTLNNLASVYTNLAEYSQAAPLYQQACDIYLSRFGNMNTHYAGVLHNLAFAQMHLGDQAEAETNYRAALQIWKSATGVQNTEYATCLTNLAGLYYHRGEFKRAEPLVRDAVTVFQSQLQDSALIQSERQQKRDLAERRRFLDERITVALGAETPAAEVLPALWTWKGSVTLRQQAYRRVASKPELAPKFTSLQSVSRQLSAIANQRPAAPAANPDDPDQVSASSGDQRWRERFESLTRQREQLEQQIAAGSAEYRALQQQLSAEELRDLLPSGAAFIDFLEYSHATPSPASKRLTEYEQRFVAFVVHPDREPVMVPLGAVDVLSRAIDEFRRPFSINDCTPEELDSADSAARRLRSELWMPLEEHLKDIQHVIISPDTVLGLLPWNALPGNHPTGYLIEEYRITTVPLAAMLRNRPDGHSNNDAPENSLLVMGDIAYDTSPDPRQTPPLSSAVNSRDTSDKIDRHNPNPDLTWTSLPGFKAELSAVEDIHRRRFRDATPILRLSGTSATEQEFLKQAPRYRTLHVVTHGFFAAPEIQSIGQAHVPTSNLVAPMAGMDPFSATRLPGLLSGLVMSGANSVSADDDGMNDGILRALEIEASSMQDVDLVVLSACETGLGPVAGGEGLTGLQRAFHLAGVHSVIASFWKVDDLATQELMRRFYRNLWQERMSKIDALREAQLWMLRNPMQLESRGVSGAAVRGLKPISKQVAARTSTGESSGRTSPYFWAAFQLSGGWR